jgi:hypothetical protein
VLRTDRDYVLERMFKDGAPLTLEKYLEYAYFGNPPEEISAELLAEIPKEIFNNPKFEM